MAFGLSSLGRAESNVLATVITVLHVLHRLADRPWAWALPSAIDFTMGCRLLADHTSCLLGPAGPGRDVRIMVTMPREAADDPTLIHDLLDQGMGCLRINCAHDDAAIWSRMLAHLHHEDVNPGDSIWFDDGKIGGIVERIDASEVVVRITKVPLRGAKLRADQGINLPDNNLRLSALTAKDVEDLRFVVQHADVVQPSFANSREDVESLQQHLERLGNRQPAIVVKIETRRGCENLPDTLLAAMRAPCCGVMIAHRRGHGTSFGMRDAQERPLHGQRRSSS